MRIFLDVGAHHGETLEVALDPRWRLDAIYAFEPARACLRILNGYRDPRLHIVPVGLSRMHGSATLFGAGMLGASLYVDKPQFEVNVEPETVILARATDWFVANTGEEDEIYLKLNCEGSECDVIEDLLNSGVINRIRSIYVDFDVRKIPSQAYRQDAVSRRLRDQGSHFVTSEALHGLSGAEAVREWLTEMIPYSQFSRGWLRYRLGLYRPLYVWGTLVARKTLPTVVYRRLAKFVGAHARARGRI